MPQAMALLPLTTATAPPAIPSASSGNDHPAGSAPQFVDMLRALSGAGPVEPAHVVTPSMKPAVLAGMKLAAKSAPTAASPQPELTTPAGTGSDESVTPGGVSTSQTAGADATPGLTRFDAARRLANGKSALLPINGAVSDAVAVSASTIQSAGTTAAMGTQVPASSAAHAGSTAPPGDGGAPNASDAAATASAATLILAAAQGAVATAAPARIIGHHAEASDAADAAARPRAPAPDALPDSGAAPTDTAATTAQTAAFATTDNPTPVAGQPSLPAAPDAMGKAQHGTAEAIGSGSALPPGLLRGSDAGANDTASPNGAATGNATEPMPVSSTQATSPPSGENILATVASLPVTSEQSATQASATATGDAGASGATGPAHQVSTALLSLSRNADGAQSMTLRLAPPELGQVEIRIDRPQDAPARVDIAVERPETMTLLLRDQPELQRALDQAGVPTDGRSLTLHVSTPDALAPSAGAHGGMTANAGSGQGGGGNGSGTRTNSTGNGEASADAAEDDETPVSAPRWFRAGLDITA